MILPSKKLLLLLLLPAVAVTLWPTRQTIAMMCVYDLALLLLAVLDLVVSAKPRDLVIERMGPSQLSLGAANKIGWHIRNEANYDIRLQITEGIPQEFVTEQLPVQCVLRGKSYSDVLYEVQPQQRGAYELGEIYMRFETRIGLLLRRQRIERTDTVKVYPNATSLTRYELDGRRRRMIELGLNAHRMRGRAGMFESLRDYVPGDDLVDISWKVSAHRRQLTTRNYEAERSQNILIVIDCGRLMTTEVAGMSRLDYAINASILLTHVAVRQNDYIGMVAFSDDIQSYMPLMKGKGAVSRMNESLYKLEPQLRESNYERVGRFLGLQQRKRSLIIFFTEVVDTEVSSTLMAYLARFARYHLPLCVTLRNMEVEAISESALQTPNDCFRQGVAMEVLDRRLAAMAYMRKTGVDVLDADPQTLSPTLIDRYLSMKRRNRL